MVSEDSEGGSRLTSMGFLSYVAKSPSAFPADCPHRSHCHSLLKVAPDTRTSQHIAGFYNGLGS